MAHILTMYLAGNET